MVHILSHRHLKPVLAQRPKTGYAAQYLGFKWIAESKIKLRNAQAPAAHSMSTGFIIPANWKIVSQSNFGNVSKTSLLWKRALPFSRCVTKDVAAGWQTGRFATWMEFLLTLEMIAKDGEVARPVTWLDDDLFTTSAPLPTSAARRPDGINIKLST